MNRLRRLIRRWTCRLNEEAAAVRGDYRTAYFWLQEGDKYRG